MPLALLPIYAIHILADGDMKQSKSLINPLTVQLFLLSPSDVQIIFIISLDLISYFFGNGIFLRAAEFYLY